MGLENFRENYIENHLGNILERVRPKELIFYNVDTQYDFMYQSLIMMDGSTFNGTLAIPGAELIVYNLEQLTAYAAKKELRTVNTADWHTKDSKEFSDEPDFIATFPAHCLMDTKGAEFITATRPKNPYVIDWQDSDFDPKDMLKYRNIVVYKDTFDVFSGPSKPHIKKVIDTIRPISAVVYGVATNVCVNDAVNGLLKSGVDVYVVTDAIKELPGSKLDEIFGNWKDTAKDYNRNLAFTTTDKVLQMYY